MKLKRFYVSQMTGRIARTPFGVFSQMIGNLVRSHTPDFKWKVVWTV